MKLYFACGAFVGLVGQVGLVGHYLVRRRVKKGCCFCSTRCWNLLPTREPGRGSFPF